MKRLLLVCLLVSPLSAQTDTKKTTAPAPKNAPAEVKIPAGAVKTEDGSYKFTDPSGKKWIYRITPFGIAKSEDKAPDDTLTPFGKVPLKTEPVVAPVKGKDPAVAFDEGDYYRFERTTPFGVTTWRKKKTELNATEQNILDQQKSKQQ
jgi:hypothetical protein